MKQRHTKQKQLVLDEVRNRCDHPTADDIYLAVREHDDRISRGTVYRNLNQLAANGEILQVGIAPADRFDLRVDRHYHLRCKRCGKVVDAPIGYQEAYDRELARMTGFSVEEHHTVFEGICPECQAAEAASQNTEGA